ncbi:alpha/beta fold hydrolase [Candidatus Riflebacteria bacterium]
MLKRFFVNNMYIRERLQDDSKKTIVYLHGLGESGLCFEKLIQNPNLDTFSHLIPDLPGYGKSIWPDQPLSMSEQAEQTYHLLLQKDIKKATVLGHSMGSCIGLFFCERFPQLVEKFINVEGNVSFKDCSFSYQAAKLSRKQFLSSGFAHILDRIYRDGLDAEALRNYFVSLKICWPEAFYSNSCELFKLSKKEEVAQRMSTLKIPVLYIAGNPGGTGKHSKGLLEKAGIKYEIVQNSGHWPFIDQESLFVDTILPYL